MNKTIVVTLPQPNLNGDSLKTLVDRNRDILHSIEALMDSMYQASPHGRNYQLKDGTYEAARDEFTQNLTALKGLKTYYDTVQEHLMDVIYDRESYKR